MKFVKVAHEVVYIITSLLDFYVTFLNLRVILYTLFTK